MITVENCSAFPHFLFEKTGLRGEVFDVLVVVGTFDIAHAVPLVPSNQQRPLVFADEYYGDPMSSSLKTEGNLVITKKSTDIHVIGHARTFRGVPATDWQVSLQVGKLKKAVRVMGPRWWEYKGSAEWLLSSPEPCSEVPLRYELAYGGTVVNEKDAQEGTGVSYEDNPVGRGFLGKNPPDTRVRYSAPQFEVWDSPVHDITASYPVEGFGPICRWWSPRRRKAGTYDDKWRKEQFPDFPDDFDFGYYNAAHPTLIYEGFLQGDEAISFKGFFPEGQVDTWLPGFDVVAILKDAADYTQPERLVLDTVLFDSDARIATITWRKPVPRSWNLKSVVFSAIAGGPHAGNGRHRLTRLSR